MSFLELLLFLYISSVAFVAVYVSLYSEDIIDGFNEAMDEDKSIFCEMFPDTPTNRDKVCSSLITFSIIFAPYTIVLMMTQEDV